MSRVTRSDPARAVRVRSSLLLAALALTALTAFLAPRARATTYLDLTPEQMVFAADMIFVGTVEDVSAGSGEEYPFTPVTFEVERWLALEGRAAPPEGSGADLPGTVTLSFMGGVGADGERLTVGGVPQFQPRQRVLVFAYDDEGLASPVVGVNQGVWTLGADGARGQTGTYLSVPEAGRLAEAPTGAGLDELAATVLDLLGSGPPADVPEAPGPAEEPVEAETDPEEPAEAETDPEEPTEAETDPEEPTDAETGLEEPPTEPAEGANADDAAAQDPVPGGAVAPEEPPAAVMNDVRYRVDESGGPLLLADAVEQAALAWEAAASEAASFTAVGADDAAAEGAAVHLIRYGDPGLFGPDALSLTLVRAGTQATEVLVNPRAGARLGAVLLHDLGVLLGLPEGGAGLDPDTPAAEALSPDPVAVAALQDLRTFRLEDINRDGVVDFYDLVALGAAFGERGINLPADLNGDGVVDSADLELLEAAYEFLPPSETAPD